MILSANETNSNVANKDHYINCPWFNIGTFWVSSAFYAPKTIHNKHACLVFTANEALRVAKLFMAFGRSKSDALKRNQVVLSITSQMYFKSFGEKRNFVVLPLGFLGGFVRGFFFPHNLEMVPAWSCPNPIRQGFLWELLQKARQKTKDKVTRVEN